MEIYLNQLLAIQLEVNGLVNIRKMIGEEYTVYTHCTKYNLNDGVREEIEPEITENQYIRIFDFIGKIPIKKKRVFITLPTVNTGSGGIYQTATIDYFEDGDIIVEVEFYSEKEMNEFMIPYWFGEEIKDEKSYSFQKFYELNADSYWK